MNFGINFLFIFSFIISYIYINEDVRYFFFETILNNNNKKEHAITKKIKNNYNYV